MPADWLETQINPRACLLTSCRAANIIKPEHSVSRYRSISTI